MKDIKEFEKYLGRELGLGAKSLIETYIEYAQSRIDNSVKSDEDSLNKFMLYYKNNVPIGTMETANQIVTAYLRGEHISKPYTNTDNHLKP